MEPARIQTQLSPTLAIERALFAPDEIGWVAADARGHADGSLEGGLLRVALHARMLRVAARLLGTSPALAASAYWPRPDAGRALLSAPADADAVDALVFLGWHGHAVIPGAPGTRVVGAALGTAVFADAATFAALRVFGDPLAGPVLALRYAAGEAVPFPDDCLWPSAACVAG